jgi:hypothetical protein
VLKKYLIEEVKRIWRQLHNEKIYNLQSSPTNVKVIKLRRTSFMGNVAYMGQMRCNTKL